MIFEITDTYFDEVINLGNLVHGEGYLDRSSLSMIVEKGSKNGIIKAIVVNGQFAGCIGITPGEFEYKRSGEIGYWLNKAYWGQGIITRAIELICNEAFASSHLNRIFGAVIAGNTGSMKALTKSGFEQEAVLKQAIYKNGVLYNNHIFSKLKAD